MSSAAKVVVEIGNRVDLSSHKEIVRFLLAGIDEASPEIQEQAKDLGFRIRNSSGGAYGSYAAVKYEEKNVERVLKPNPELSPDVPLVMSEQARKLLTSADATRRRQAHNDKCTAEDNEKATFPAMGNGTESCEVTSSVFWHLTNLNKQVASSVLFSDIFDRDVMTPGVRKDIEDAGGSYIDMEDGEFFVRAPCRCVGDIELTNLEITRIFFSPAFPPFDGRLEIGDLFGIMTYEEGEHVCLETGDGPHSDEMGRHYDGINPWVVVERVEGITGPYIAAVADFFGEYAAALKLDPKAPLPEDAGQVIRVPMWAVQRRVTALARPQPKAVEASTA